MEQMTYKASGVDIDAGNESVRLIKDFVRSTYRPEVLGDIGGFGGLFKLKDYDEPILVSGTDGVGTKLKIAFLLDKHDTIGQDAVAMCVNDILVQGAEPLFFLDYLAVGKLEPAQVAEIVKGVAEACKASGCALIGGETAEMNGFYPAGEYDIAGFAVGVVERKALITPARVKVGDVLIGLPSSGLHSNGFSLVRKIVFERMNFKGDEFISELGKTIGEELLTPTTLYPAQVLPIIREYGDRIHGLVHVTGGGFYDNIPRALPESLGAVIDADSWSVPKIFKLLQAWGNVERREMFRTFNCGIGMILIVDADIADEIDGYKIGRVVEGANVTINGGELDD
ncbi:MAG: phosphoribosylformylglycinamidine cyclo-ligase [Selenomonadaceae bacterium]|nr:phosphoribosylformylglycinamidine cyclo-ligase [Selenomonadaceae bacterium]